MPGTDEQGSPHNETLSAAPGLEGMPVVVADLPGPFGERVREQADVLGTRHTLVQVPVEGLEEELLALPVKVSTTGLGVEQDRAAFLSAAAGRHATQLL